MEKEHNMTRRIIAVFTGNRAEYGLQYSVLRAIDRHPDLDYRLLVSGAHLNTNFGSTLDEIRKDGFHIDAEVKIDMDTATLYATAQAIGSGVLSVSRVLNELRPDMMVVYGDRFEALAAVIASSQMNIPTAHIEGGDLTEGGALDDSVRHAITKLSHLHFTTNQQASNRVLGMGEESWRVRTVGFPAIDLISEGKYAKANEIKEELGLDLSRPIVLFTQHSVTTEFDQAAVQLSSSLVAIENLALEGVQTILTYPNNDAGGQEIIAELEAFGNRRIPGTQIRRSLGRHLYHGVLSLARNPSVKVACLGNSSSGLKETPAFGCPTVNIGSRQKGRLRGENVLDVDYEADAIEMAIRRCLFDAAFRQRCETAKNPYWQSDVGPSIAEVLATVSIDTQLVRKRMMLEGEAQAGWFK